jgi:hypothetical protein
MNRESLSGDSSESCAKMHGNHQIICCRDHTNFTHTSAGIGFWTYVDWDRFAHLSEYYTLLKPVTLLLTLYIEERQV